MEDETEQKSFTKPETSTKTEVKGTWKPTKKADTLYTVRIDGERDGVSKSLITQFEGPAGLKEGLLPEKEAVKIVPVDWRSMDRLFVRVLDIAPKV